MNLAVKHWGWASKVARGFARRFKGSDPDEIASTYIRRIGASPDRTGVMSDTEQFKNFSASIMRNAAFNQATKRVQGLRHIEQYQQVVGLTEQQATCEDLEESRSAINRVLDRYEDAAWIMRMHLDGKSNRWIASAKDVDDKTVATWIAKYKDEIARELGCVA